jgi:hypothetical protein
MLDGNPQDVANDFGSGWNVNLLMMAGSVSKD